MADYVEPQDRVKEYLDHGTPDWGVIATTYSEGLEYNLLASDVKDVLNDLLWYQERDAESFVPTATIEVEYAEGSDAPYSLSYDGLHVLAASLGAGLAHLAALQLQREAGL